MLMTFSQVKNVKNAFLNLKKNRKIRIREHCLQGGHVVQLTSDSDLVTAFNVFFVLVTTTMFCTRADAGDLFVLLSVVVEL